MFFALLFLTTANFFVGAGHEEQSGEYAGFRKVGRIK